MDKFFNLILIISIIVIILCGAILIFPSIFKSINEYLSGIADFIAYLGMLFAAIALLIAVLAYKSANLNPNLKLNLYAWMNDKDGPALLLDKKTNIVSECRPLTEWYFILDNIGKVSAKYPVVQLDFSGAYFKEDDFPGWKAIHHANALGWFGFQWYPAENEIVYPGISMQLPTMYFSGKQIDEIPLEIIVVIAADRFKKKTLKFPVKIEYEDSD